jgi:hypothetical protein
MAGLRPTDESEVFASTDRGIPRWAVRCRRGGWSPTPGAPAGPTCGGLDVRIALFLVPLVLAVFCLVQAITSREDEVRHLGKVWWILLILFFPFIGSIAWLVAGRPVRGPRRTGPHERNASAFPEYDRPGRFAASDPAADEEFLKKVRERAEEQRRRAAEQKRREREGDAGGEADPA